MATALTKSQRRLILRLQNWQRQSQVIYELSAIPSINNYRLRYVMKMEDVCYETVLSETCDAYQRLCPGSTEVWFGDVLLLKALYNKGSEVDDCVALPSENVFRSHLSDFGSADSSSAVVEFNEACSLLYFCSAGRRVAYFDLADREWHSAGFRFSSPASPNTSWLVRDGADDSILRCFLNFSTTYGTEFLLPLQEGLTQEEIEEL